MEGTPFIPEYITVHLGRPGEAASNVTVTFPDYIKNVASSEIYPTWPESAIRANIYAQISFALNRIYTEWYPSQGYDFDITNSTAFDQAFVPNRDIFENVGQIVDEIFNSYVRRPGTVEPYFTQYCNGTTVTCPGLSQWGTVPLAQQGMTPYEILTYFYGDDLEIVDNVRVALNTPSYPGVPLRLGSIGNDVRTKQIQLNRISRNYPAIPKIQPVDGVFGSETEDAVRVFQRLFNLQEDGVIGNATWYRIAYLFSAVKKLSELSSEGITYEEIAQQFPSTISPGDTGINVQIIQYYLAVLGQYYEELPPFSFDSITGVFDENTRYAVTQFQTVYGLTPDGIVGRETWNEIVRAYRGVVMNTPVLEGGVVLFPGTALVRGSTGEDVRLLQEYLLTVSRFYPEIPTVTVDGIFGPATESAVRALQGLVGIEPTGQVGPVTWNSLASLYSDVTVGNNKQAGQYPGAILYETSEEDQP